ncbi:LPXTG cell wall anchor domain-containing protein [Nocardiopsis flavescens]
MKTSTTEARRALRAGAVFAALGALSLAWAAPATADEDPNGFAESGINDRANISHLGPRGGDVHGVRGYLHDGDIWAVGITSILVDVDEDVLRSWVRFEELGIRLTESDIREMLADDASPADVDGTSEEEPAQETEAPSPAPEGTEEPEPTEAPEEPAVTPSPGAPEEEILQDAPGTGDDGVASVVGLDENTAALASAGDDVVLDADFTGVWLRLQQSWSGGPAYGFDEVETSFSVNEYDAEISFSTEELVWEDRYQGQRLWGAAHFLEMVVEFPEQGLVVTYPLGQTWVGSPFEPTAGGGEDGGSEGGESGNGPEEGGSGGGDEGNESAVGMPVPADKSTDTLPRTGSPVVGLIAAGAAIAAGGGAAAYLARRRKREATA